MIDLATYMSLQQYSLASRAWVQSPVSRGSSDAAPFSLRCLSAAVCRELLDALADLGCSGRGITQHQEREASRTKKCYPT